MRLEGLPVPAGPPGGKTLRDTVHRIPAERRRRAGKVPPSWKTTACAALTTSAQVAAALPPPTLAEFREMRALASRARAPQQVVLSDLKEAKIYRALYSAQ